MGFLTTSSILLISSSTIACIFFFSIASATSSLAPLSQILQTESIPPDVLSIFSRYFPSSLLTDYSAVSHELSILMDSTGVTVLEGTKTYEYGGATSSYTEISGGLGGSGGSASTAATATAVSATLTATTTPLSSSTGIMSSSAIASATAASSSSGSSETTSQSETSTLTAGATSFVGSPWCLGMILAISTACLFGTLV
ncbi:uncharacterized protein V1513DRAFT_442677 [Lipomyces chichibuensis]|uniref:uncharacterized protein n=1 Tax=Lipomyces chichibuensis TaxID=1546026 RepID=UPI0033435725